MKLELAHFIVEALKNSGGDEYDHPEINEDYVYDGYEDPTVAVVMEQSLLAFASAVAIESRHANSDPSDAEIKLLEGIAYLRQDSMGARKVVLY